MVEGGLRFLIFYFAIFAGVFLLGFYGAPELSLSGEFPDPPTLADDNLTILSSIIFVFEIVIFFFFLQGLTIFGLPVIFATLISLSLNIGLFYVLARLIRGGG